MISRRCFLSRSAALSASAWLAPRVLFGQEAKEPAIVINGRATAANAKITVTPLRGGVSALIGSGGNIAVLTAKEGKLLVDAGISTSRPQIMEALAGINGDSIRILVNTHWHWDHTDGNEWIHSMGATIWAHENTRFRMAAPQHVEFLHADFPASPVGALPTILFNPSRMINGDGNTLELDHYDPAHTDSDISVHFLEADILHTGDTWFSGMYPFIDYSTGGNIDGMIRATQKSLAIGTNSTIVIPGHGAVGNKQQLSDSLDMLTAIRGKVSTLKQQGKSVDEAIAAKPTAQFDEKWAKGFVTPDMFVRLVYQGV
jgi:glyoxylase-like metal-dependent hydrolase (beta-lactamase superfamily II)